MANNSLKKLVEVFKTVQHPYKPSTEFFGQLDVDRLAKELKLEENGTKKGKKNEPTTTSQVPDKIETKIRESVESSKKEAHHLAENELHAYNERISNLDFEGHFSQLRLTGPKVVSEIQANVTLSLNEMFRRRRKLLAVQSEFEKFQSKNGLTDRTAKVPGSAEKFLRYLILIILFVSETYFNGTYLAKSSSTGLIGGVFEAATFALLNMGFSIIIALYGIKQIFRPEGHWKLIGSISILLWLIAVLIFNLSLAHYREIAGSVLDGAGQQVLTRILESPFGLVELESWMLFSIGALFALITLVDVFKFSDLFPGYTAVQQKLDTELEDYNFEFQSSVEELEEIKNQYYEDLNRIGEDLSVRQVELDKITSNKNRLSTLYEAHHQQLQSSSDALFSFYYESNQLARKTKPPIRFDKQNLVTKMALSKGEGMQPREAQNIKKRISEAKKFLEEQMKIILSEFADGIEKFNNLDNLFESDANGSEKEV